MPKSCAAFGCKKIFKAKDGISFHRFPFSRPDILKKWIIALRFKNWTPSKYQHICSQHFTADDYLSGYVNRLQLKTDAVPSIFNFPKHMLKKMTPRKPPKERIFVTEPSTVEADSTVCVESPPVNQFETEDHCYALEKNLRKLKLSHTRVVARMKKRLCDSRKKIHGLRLELQLKNRQFLDLIGILNNLKKKHLLHDSAVDVISSVFSGAFRTDY